MEVERGLFLMYENALYSMAADTGADSRRCSPVRACRATLGVMSALTSAVVLLLCLSHAAYVGNPGCFGEALSAVAAAAAAQSPGTNFSFERTDVFRVRVLYDRSASDGMFRGGAGGGALDPSPDFAPHYLYGAMPEGVTMGQAMRTAHGFRPYNISLPLSCAASSQWGMDGLLRSGLLSYDTVIINSAMATFRDRPGYLVSAVTSEAWSWVPMGQLESDVKGVHSGSRGVGMSIVARLSSLASIVVVFVFVSSLCSVMARVHLISGPALLAPLHACLVRLCGAHRLMDERDLFRPFPWLAYPIRRLVASRVSPMPLLAAHAWFVTVMTVGLLSAATVYTQSLLSEKSYPSELSAIWLMFIVAEQFSLVMVRSRLSIAVFPRVFFYLWIVFGAYHFAYPYPLSNFAALAFILATLTLMVAVVHVFEVPLLRAGGVDVDKPRELMVRLPVPGDDPTGPPLWSMFHDLNYRPTGAYTEPVPQLMAVVMVDGRAAPQAGTETRQAAEGGEGAGNGAPAPGVIAGPAAGGGMGAVGGGELTGAAGSNGRVPLLDEAEYAASGNAEGLSRG